MSQPPSHTVFQVTEAWEKTYPQAQAGVLVMFNVTNPAQHDALEQRKAALEAQLRSQYAAADRHTIEQDPVIQAYNTYYRAFKKSYHVQLQLESIVFKGKALPSGAGLVEAMFMAEIQHLLLTAGHDLDRLRLPIQLDVATGQENYTLLRGQEQRLKAGDMFMADGTGIISSILYGPDQRTQIDAGTQNVVFTVYAPPGIETQMLHRHLQAIQHNVLLVAPQAEPGLLQVFSAA